MVTYKLYMTDSVIKIKVQEESEINHISGGINWQIEERQANLNNGQWLWALAIVGFAIIVFSVMLKNYLLIIIVALTTFIIYASKNKTKKVK